nr:ribonuclease H-like domain-containing protein [Tanacetum cinerariifolium]
MKDIAIGELKRKLEVAQKEKDGIQLTIEKLKNASKSLKKLIDCQIVNNCKKALGYEKYNVVPPPYTGNFMPPKPDLSFTGLDEFANKHVAENTKSSEEETKAVRKNGNPQMDLQDKRVIDSRCSRHMKGNLSYLTDYKEINEGYVAFGGNPKGEKIIGKGTKDETSGILKSFITRIENLVDHKVKAEAINTVCYVQNRVLVVKPHNKTPYELFHGTTPTLSFMRQFGCPVTILNTKDPLRKFDGKADECFFVGYSWNSKAFRVFNSRTRIVEENLHISISENTPNVIGSRPDWLFDIDALTRTMNYESIVVVHSLMVLQVDEGFLVGYSVCSKAFRVFNSRTRTGQETLHVNFMENKPNVTGSGPAWLFDIDSLSQTMNYHPVLAENQTNSHVGFQDTKKAVEEGTQTYVLFPVLSDGFTNPKNNKDAHTDGKEHDDDIQKSVSPDIHSSSCGDQTRKQGDKAENKDKGKSLVVTITGFRDLNAELEECTNNSSNGVNAVSSSVSTAGHNFINSTNDFSAAGPSNAAMQNLENITHSNDVDDVGAEADINNLESIISVSPIPTTRIHKDHPTS